MGWLACSSSVGDGLLLLLLLLLLLFLFQHLVI
jgi:MYXO-CTERM domain-containing protein